MELFRKHFHLFHFLYLLQAELEKKRDYFLHIYTMNITLVKYPPLNKCTYFEKEMINFCNLNVDSEGYCKYHAEYLSGKSLQNNAVKWFYLNYENLLEMTEKNLERLYNDASYFLSYYGEIKKSLKLFNLSENSLKKDLVKKFRKFALENHPDLNKGREETFIQYNHAYKVLLPVLK
ncbi:MAG: DnaJ domain-containing protein [Nitrospinae bacterium]|nr:DnaJ domain-containing protein [Nitrospinota bacterium]